MAVVGGGQLARMMAPAAGELGVHLRVLVEAPEASAGQVLADTPVGAASDAAAVRALVAGTSADGWDAPLGRARADVLTFEHEHVPGEILAETVESGVPVHPGAHALVHAQDKIVMRERLTALGVPCPAWAALPRDPEGASAALAAFLAEHADAAGQAVLKTSRGGYDGKGVRLVSSAEQAADWFDGVAAGGPALLVEEKVPFARELAVVVARRPSGDAVTYPVVESVQRDGVCAEVVAPAPDLDDALAHEARTIALAIAEGLDVTGVLAVEMFEVDGRVLVNELAMRPHNSGHWTIDGAVTSQFEQHLRAVLDLPLGDPSPRARWTVMGNVLGGDDEELYSTYRHLFARDPGLKMHLYGKGVRPGRKIGHVTVCGDDLTDLRERAAHAADFLEGTVRE